MLPQALCSYDNVPYSEEVGVHEHELTLGPIEAKYGLTSKGCPK